MNSKHSGAGAGPSRTRLVYSIADVTKLVGLGRTFVYHEIKEGRLPVRKAGRRTLVLEGDLQAWLSAMPNKPTA
jgi:excisionase family DNA binding protein